MKNKIMKPITAAMLAGLICVATMLIRIPSPMNGYVNLGDSFILAASWILGPVYGFAAGGIGSALADLFSGYPHYIPGTFIIKGAMAAAAAVITKAIASRGTKFRYAGYFSGAIVAELIMISGYFVYAALIFGEGFAAALSVPGNAVQGLCGVAGGVFIIRSLDATGLSKKVNTYIYSGKTAASAK